MQLDEIVKGIAERHVAQSLAEMLDPAKLALWKSGDRAKNQAASIMSEMVAEANKSLEMKGSDEKPKT